MKKQNESVHPKLLSKYVMNNDMLVKALGEAKDVLYIVETKNNEPIYANKSILQVLGYSVPEIEQMGLDWKQAVTHPDDYEFLATHTARYKSSKDKSISRVVYRMHDHEGVWHVFESIAARLAGTEKGQDVVVGITREIPDTDAIHASNHENLEYRCRNCQKLLGIEKQLNAEFEIKCLRCGEFNVIKLHNT